MTLATVSKDGAPAAHTISYASEDEVLYFSTDKHTLKAANIKVNPKVSYVVYDTDLLTTKYPKMPDMPEEYEPVFIKVEPKKGVFIDSTVHFGFAAELQY
jgi:nitroimidazol reductase NimA-like FMN-containing flavoprotein (pyridoxamine 5'-phosphate oxidase superfamily)